MKIMMFIPALNAGGAERVMVTLANYLVGKGHNVRIQTINTTDSFYSLDNRVDVRGMDYQFSGNLFVRKLQIPIIEAKRRTDFVYSVREYKPNIVLSFLYTTNVIALLAHRQIGIPLVISERNDPTIGGIISRRICAALYPKANLIVCQGKMVSQHFERLGGSCTVISNPINSEAVGHFEIKRKKQIVTVGRLIPQKNHKMLIDAFAMLYSRYKDCSLMIVGEGPLRDELEKQIQILNLESVVSIHNNIKNVMTKVNDSACFVLSSDYEGFPNVLLEAMASGMPVVSTDFGTGIARELITDGVNGYVVPVGASDQMAEAIEKIIISEEVQTSMGQRNLVVKDIYSEDAICAQWEEALCKVMEKDNVRES